MEGRPFNASFGRRGVFAPDFGLSFDCRRDQEPYEKLKAIGVHWKVGKPLATWYRHDPKSVRQAVINAAAKGDDYRRRMRRLNLPPPRFNLAGYTIATLNQARAECHGVKPSKLARAAAARGDDGARAAAVGRLPEAELKQRKKEQIRRLRTTPAEPVTPYSDDKLALIASKRDKKAEAEYLTRVLAAARFISYSCWRRANRVYNQDFYVNPCE
ncbi:hypothetical protein ES703_71559 [subsurface metagenome]